ncbi:GT4 family glycosyltransferase PelF [Deinococcus pimensis]|uniref:GT4 family glycosyltransferase PelF n=1 Tax=Deinococcus pimensis TaxID=309888 RepID=UPI0004BAB52B|nr:GT4 family glycosyltransferase PelF [Deinococcus pimensis]
MKIALLTEGTYPQIRGGVSTWCDQLVQGLGEHDFHVYAICGDDTAQTLFDLPPNVRDVHYIPLWGARSAPGPRPRRIGNDFHIPHARLLETLFSPTPNDTVNFTEALRDLHVFAQQADFSEAMNHRVSVERLWREWQRASRRAPSRGALLPLLPTPSIADALHASIWLDHLLRPLAWPAPKVDVTHATGNGLSTLLAFTARWTYGTPCIMTEHGMYLRERYLEYPRLPFSPALRAFLVRFQILLSQAAYDMVSTITPVSEYNSRWAARSGGADAGRIKPVYNGIDPVKFTPASTEPDRPTICWVGRIDPLKDVETLIRAFAIVHEGLPDATLRLFGGVPKGNEAYAKRCHDLVTSLGLDASVRFEGHTQKVLDGYHAGHLVALSSISEGFPYTIIEAMSAGRVNVATDVGGVREAIGPTGRVVPPRDERAFAAACLELLHHA